MVARRSTAESAETIGAVRCERPQTGAEYLESLRDGREVFIYGDKVDDVTSHPAFRNTARMTARLFDALHDEEKSKKILLPTDTDGKGKTHAFFKDKKHPCMIHQGVATIRIKESEMQRHAFLFLSCLSF